MMFILFFTLLALSQIQVFAQNDYCFGKDNERLQTRQYSTKTAYQIVKGINMEKQHQVPNCEARKIWILHRHGTRLPSVNTIQQSKRLEELRDEIVNNYRVRKTKPENGGLCPEDLLTIQMWKWNNSITDDQENTLTPQGWEDLRGTAKLYQRLFPDVLTKEYSPTNYLFRYSNAERSKDSFKAFTDSLFGPNANQNIHVPDDSGNDTILRPYAYCSKWIEMNDAKDDIGSEIFKFKHSALMNSTLSEISTRIGFRYTLDWSDVDIMFDICRYEQAWQVDRTSPWCAVFTPQQTRVLEYYEDLNYYYKSGYGSEINTRLNCKAVQDMLTHLNSKSTPYAVAYFAHSTDIHTFIAALGINKDDEDLTAENYEQMAHRRWKTSLFGPFAANFLAVKYECDDDEDKVIFFLNQEAVDLDWCKVGLCDWSDVMKKYEKFYNADCSEYYCTGGSGTSEITMLALLTAAIISLIY